MAAQLYNSESVERCLEKKMRLNSSLSFAEVWSRSVKTYKPTKRLISYCLEYEWLGYKKIIGL